MDFNWILETATLCGIGAITYFLKKTLAGLEKRIEATESKVDVVENKLEGKIGELEKELDDLKSDLPFIYVTREDFIRVTNNVDNKLDKIYECMMDRGKYTSGR